METDWRYIVMRETNFGDAVCVAVFVEADDAMRYGQYETTRDGGGQCLVQQVPMRVALKALGGEAFLAKDA